MGIKRDVILYLFTVINKWITGMSAGNHQEMLEVDVYWAKTCVLLLSSITCINTSIHSDHSGVKLIIVCLPCGVCSHLCIAACVGELESTCLTCVRCLCSFCNCWFSLSKMQGNYTSTMGVPSPWRGSSEALRKEPMCEAVCLFTSCIHTPGTQGFCEQLNAWPAVNSPGRMRCEPRRALSPQLSDSGKFRSISEDLKSRLWLTLPCGRDRRSLWQEISIHEGCCVHQLCIGWAHVKHETAFI